MHEDINPNCLFPLHPGSLAACTRLSFRVCSWEESDCFLPIAGVRNPSLLLLLLWDAFFRILSWPFSFSLPSSPFEQTLILDTSCYQSAESGTKAPDLFFWGLLCLLFPPYFFLSSTLHSSQVWWGGWGWGCGGCVEIHVQEQQNAVHKLFLLQSWQHRLGLPDLGWETSACWERLDLSWKPSVVVLHPFS